MPFEIIRADITKLNVDAIVNASDHSLSSSGGVDRAIHKAAGRELQRECEALGGCQIGQALITKGYNLPARYVIHTAGPIWTGGNDNEAKKLASCYKNALLLAVEYRLNSIAFPLISSGVFGYPKDKALQTAVSAISEFLMHNDLMVYLVVYDKKAFVLSEKLFSSVKAYIDDNYIEDDARRCYNRAPEMLSLSEDADNLFEEICPPCASKPARSLDDLLAELQDTFSEHLLRLIDQKGKTDVETYKRANVDRKLFSKIRSDKFYRPSKSTVIAFAIALELSLDETKDLLLKAGFALSHSSKFDLIIEFFISEENYNIHEINETLFAFDQPLLGV